MNTGRYFRLITFIAISTMAPLHALSAPMPESFADLAASLKPSVVNISSIKVIKNHGFQGQMPGQGDERLREFFGDDFFRRFFGTPPGGGDAPREFKSSSLGSGFIWDATGYVITNNHVIKDTTEVKVILEGGKEFDAKVIGGDDDTDVALLKIDPGATKLVPVKRGDSDALRVGDWVLAIGNPFGYGHTVTAGIISAKERVIGSGPYDDFLQTDAAINPGNSGGPLFDIKGGVVGINSAKIEGASSIGFAIPINMATQVVDQLIKNNGVVTRAWLGVAIQEVTEELARNLGLKESGGALVSQVFENGPADKAGFQRGDVILKFDGKTIDRSTQLPYIVASHKPGSVVRVDIIRKGETRSLEVKLGTKDPKRMGPAEGETESRLGITVQEISAEIRKGLGIKAEKGVVVTSVDADGPAMKAGFKRGDVIIEVNRVEVEDIDSYRKALSAAGSTEGILMLVERGGQTSYKVVNPKTAK